MKQIKGSFEKTFKKAKKPENFILAACSLALTISAFYFFPGISFWMDRLISPLFLFLSAVIAGTLALTLSKSKIISVLRKLLIFYSPVQAVFLFSIASSSKRHASIGFLVAFYFLFLAVYLVASDLKNKKVQADAKKEKGGKSARVSAVLIALVMILNFSFGMFNLGKMAVVDESLWTFDRIPNFWRDALEGDWYGSRVSDKPGFTVAVISGAGLLFENDPKQFKTVKSEGEVYNANADKLEQFNIKFRLPMLLFSVLMLPLFYWLLKLLFNRSTALFSVIFIGLSPILLGNSRIINPDGILWIFTALSMLAFFVFLKNEDRKFLYLSALMLGLGILTKYTASILYLYFLLLFFARYLFDKKYADANFGEYLKNSLGSYWRLVLISAAVFYVFYPAVWGKPERLLIGTIYSQAFGPIWPFFAGLILIILADLFLLRSFLASSLMRFLKKIRTFIFKGAAAIFLISIALSFANLLSGSKWLDFQSVLSSPKSSYLVTGSVGMFISNFHPLLFGISALALVAAVFYSFKILRKGDPDGKSLYATYFISFIIIYYLGSIFSDVASIIRYQIILYPIIFILAGLGADEFLNFISKKFPEKKMFFLNSFLLLSIISLSAVLFSVKPFYMGYASSLLPKEYYLDMKDMGEGSYEAAQYLNSLPDAEKIQVWTDKLGVCVFFKGRCYSSLSSKFFAKTDVDYFVISSGRASRTPKVASTVLLYGKVPLGSIYSIENDLAFKLEINGRPNNYTKIISADTVREN